MCGRLDQHSDMAVLERRDAGILFRDIERLQLRPRYNLPPTAKALIVRNQGTDGGHEPIRAVWKLIPPWEKEPSTKLSTFNAKAETITTSRLYAQPWKAAKRCLVPIDGFYEWDKYQSKPKPAYHIVMGDGEPYCLAGLWSTWRRGDESVDSFTVITCEPNSLVERLHNRMPVILAPEDYRTWLDPETPLERAQALLKPYPAELMLAVPVSLAVGKPENDYPEIIEPIGPPLAA